MNIILIGSMGTGKSVVGKIIAERLGWAFWDTDAMIEKETGFTVAQIFKSQGEAAFRQMEARAVQLVAILDKTVVATGGGVPLRAENMAELERNGTVVCLTARPETILERLDAGEVDARPLLKDKDPLLAVEEILRARKKAYARAKFSVATDDLTPDEVAEKVLKAVSIE
jgi:shikimate kinase